MAARVCAVHLGISYRFMLLLSCSLVNTLYSDFKDSNFFTNNVCLNLDCVINTLLCTFPEFSSVYSHSGSSKPTRRLQCEHVGRETGNLTEFDDEPKEARCLVSSDPCYPSDVSRSWHLPVPH